MQSHSPGAASLSVRLPSAMLVSASPKRVLSSHLRVQSLKRLTTLTLFGLFVLFLYLTSNCWPAIFNLFDHRRYMLDELGQRSRNGQTCLFSYQSGQANPSQDNPSQASRPPHRASLLARPLKHSLDSLSVRQLTLRKVQSLIKHTNQSEGSVTNTSKLCPDLTLWKSHRKETSQDRVNRLDHICSIYDFSDRIFTYRPRASNRQDNSSQQRYCPTRICPLLVSKQAKVLTCFVQKVASTSIKRIFVRLAESTYPNRSAAQGESVVNLTAFHLTANDYLHRVSPIYIRRSKESFYFKAIFVRHPFVRLVSAFKDKAERGPEQEPFFYTQYWYPLLKRIYGEDQWNQSTRVTFVQFVEELLLQTDPYLYDEHWAPIWTRCDPCFVHYDFIGKLESSNSDFEAFKIHIDKQLLNETIWENQNSQFVSSEPSEPKNASNRESRTTESKYIETRRYLVQLKPESIIELYKRYYLDFELFGYSLEELFR